jgi:hypothetical protein
MLPGQATTCILGIGMAALLMAGEAPKKPVWLKDYTAARDAARQSGKPIFLVFR